ncbi:MULTISPECIES: ABC transporter substrate-binding protein [unclassified Aeromicrobium]|uniref:ABC transporter substrate-binding protein n=1 Tax=unclassified Aeromicrobium TaxID=2633570 RepID=UPI00396B30B0
MRIAKTMKVVAAAALMTAVLSACGGSDEKSAGSTTLRVAAQSDVSSLDPIRGNSGNDHVMLFPIYDTLVSFDEGLQPQPGLVESWDSPSPNELTLTLRSGVTFHDGEPLDADAVKVNLDRARAEDSVAAADLASIENVRVDDELVVTLELSRPDASLLLVLADRAGMMVSPAALEANDNDVSRNPVGAGGWKLSDWKQGNELRLERFDDYWDEDAERAESLRIKIITDPRTRVTAMRSGQQDIALDVQPVDAESLEKEKSVVLESQTSLLVHGMYMNTSAPQFSDATVRRALALAIDRDTIVKNALFGHGQPASGVLPDGYWAETPDSVDYAYDPDEAKRLLAEAGEPDLEFDMLSRSDTSSVRLAEILKDQWAAVGVTVNILPRDVVEATDQYFNQKSSPAYLAGWSGRPDPSMTYRSLFDAKGYYNVGGLDIDGMAEAIGAADKSFDLDERVVGLDAAAVAAYESTPFLPVAFQDALIARSDKVQGFQMNQMGKPKFIGITVD